MTAMICLVHAAARTRSTFVFLSLNKKKNLASWTDVDSDSSTLTAD